MFGFKSSAAKDNSHCLLKEVGIAEINKQHLRLASYAVQFGQIVDELSTREPSNQDWRQIDALFSKVMRYVATHFEEEEALMREHGYPDYEAHKKLHDKFSAEMVKLQSDINNRNIKFKKKMSSLLWDWLYNHINTVDYQYRDFFLSKGLS
ncbi:MAG: bacteriohemerythrin [Pseudomonadota bacterium]|jgi:hemerythrin|nr:bacteriohemerythrin [Pseudomonadota bacterium]